jgi:Tfp pilus assembly ATPase PilU
MAPTPEENMRAVVAASPLSARYGTAIDRESAYEILSAKLNEGAARAEAERLEKERAAAEAAAAKERAAAEKAEAAAERERRRIEREADAELARLDREAARARAQAEKEAKAAEAARRKWEKENPTLIEQVTKSSVFKDLVRTAGREIIRGVFGTGKRR